MTSGFFNFLFALINLITKGLGNGNKLKKLKNFFFILFFLMTFLELLMRFIELLMRFIELLMRFIDQSLNPQV